jgi:hypothetical protein
MISSSRKSAKSQSVIPTVPISFEEWKNSMPVLFRLNETQTPGLDATLTYFLTRDAQEVVFESQVFPAISVRLPSFTPRVTDILVYMYLFAISVIPFRFPDVSQVISQLFHQYMQRHSSP